MNAAAWLSNGLLAGALAATAAALLRACLPRTASAAARHDAHLAVILSALFAFAGAGLAPRVELPWLAPGALSGAGLPQEHAASSTWPWYLLPWAAVAFALLARRLVAECTLLRFANRALPLDSRIWKAVLAEHAERLGIRGPLRLATHPAVVGGATFAVRRPIIVLDPAARAGASDRWRAVLAHELAHVRRRDPLASLAADLARALFWFLPWVWGAARGMRIERELACDDLVVSLGARPSSYGAVLLDLFRCQQAAAAGPGGQPGLAWNALATPAGRHSASLFEHRLRALLRRGKREPPAARRRSGLAFVALAALFVAGVRLVPAAGALPAQPVVAAATVEQDRAVQIPAAAIEHDHVLPAASAPSPRPLVETAPQPARPSRPSEPIRPAAQARIPVRGLLAGDLESLPEELRQPVQQAIADALRDVPRESVRLGPISVSVIRRTLAVHPAQP